MKSIFTPFLCLVFGILSAQSNFELSTLRIGPFHLKMSIDEAEKIAGKKLQTNEIYTSFNAVRYNNEVVNLNIYEILNENNSKEKKIAQIKTKSPKFKTKSGAGVGTTRHQLLEMYKDFPSFEIFQSWNEDGTISKVESVFNLNDTTSGSILMFSLRNNIVVEVSVFYDEGC